MTSSGKRKSLLQVNAPSPCPTLTAAGRPAGSYRGDESTRNRVFYLHRGGLTVEEIAELESNHYSPKTCRRYIREAAARLGVNLGPARSFHNCCKALTRAGLSIG